LGKTWIDVGQFLCQFIAHCLGLDIGDLPMCIVQRRLWYAFRVCFAKIEIALKALIEDRP
jgi:hypothetical protein